MLGSGTGPFMPFAACLDSSGSSNVSCLGSPYRETMRNWKKVIRTPEFGYRDVMCSKVMALLDEGLSFRMKICHVCSAHLQQPPNTSERLVIQSDGDNMRNAGNALTLDSRLFNFKLRIVWYVDQLIEDPDHVTTQVHAVNVDEQGTLLTVRLLQNWPT